jgi:hypothetical protein
MKKTEVNHGWTLIQKGISQKRTKETKFEPQIAQMTQIKKSHSVKSVKSVAKMPFLPLFSLRSFVAIAFFPPFWRHEDFSFRVLNSAASVL